MATKQALKRLTKEYKLIVENPPQFIEARPNEDNILEWHYIITGPPPICITTPINSYLFLTE